MKTIVKWICAVAGLAVPAVIGVQVLACRAFSRRVRRDAQALIAGASPAAGEHEVVTEEMLADLPEPVRRYLRYTGVVGRPFPRTVRLRQHGRMRTGPGRPWITLDAEEHYSVQPPGFVWAGRAHLGPLPVAQARDMYAGGEGRMLVKAGALVTVVDASGEQMDQGGMMRYLSEMLWFPSAFLAGNVLFEPVDGSSARVTFTDHGRTATGTLVFDQQGRVTDFVAKRYRTPDASAPDTWSTPITGYRQFEGLQLPVRGKAVWKLPDGDMEYIDVTITELEYDTGATGPVTAPGPGRSA